MNLPTNLNSYVIVIFCAATACAGKAAPVEKPAELPALPVLVKKVALSWAFANKASATEVFLALTDETGKVKSNPVGTFEGQCSVVSVPAVANSITAASCTSGGIGFEIHAVRGGAELIILKIPVAPGAQVDALAGSRLPSIPVPLDANVEAGK
jgi:hypothetical protein